tara:strand:- start:622 stop:804 length:183 start_codon:yes stop_codon:yes gene_type:complete
MSENKTPCFYTNMMNTLESLDSKVGEIQTSIRIFRAMINERISTEEPTTKEKAHEEKESD